MNVQKPVLYKEGGSLYSDVTVMSGSLKPYVAMIVTSHFPYTCFVRQDPDVECLLWSVQI